MIDVVEVDRDVSRVRARVIACACETNRETGETPVTSTTYVETASKHRRNRGRSLVVTRLGEAPAQVPVQISLEDQG